MKQLKKNLNVTERVSSRALKKHPHSGKKIAKKVQDYQHLFRILGGIKDAFILFDNDTRYLYANKEALQLIGKKQTEIEGKKVLDIFDHASDHPLYTKMIEAIKKRKSLEYEYYAEFVKKWLYVKFYPSKYGIAVYCIDITKQKDIEGKKNETEEKYRTLARLAPDVIYSVDLKGTIVSLSPAFEKLSGWRSKDWIGKSFLSLIHPDDTSRAVDRFKIGLKKKIPPYDLRVLTRSGKYKIGEFHNQRNIVGGKVIGKTGVVRDVTEHNTLFSELNTRLQQQSAVVELSLMALRGVRVDSLCKIALEKLALGLDVGFAEILEAVDQKKLVIRTKYGWGDDIVENSTTLPMDVSSQVGVTMVSKKPIIVKNLATEKRFTPAPMAKKYHVVSGMSVLIHGEKKPYGVLALHSQKYRTFNQYDQDFLQAVANIIAMAVQTAKQQNEIRQREKLFRSLIEYSSDAVRLVDKNGNVQYASPSIKKILGYSVDEYKLMSVFDIMHPDDVSAYKQVLHECVQHPSKPYKLVYRLRHKNGSWRWMDGIGRSLLHVQGVEAIVSNFRDITQRIELQHALVSLNERLQLAVSMAHLARWSIDLQSGKIEMGQQSRNILGIAPAVQLTLNKFNHVIFLDDRKQFMKAMDTSIKQHSRLDTEFRLVTTKGNIKWIWAMGQAVFDSNKPVRFDIVALDVSPSKERDERKDEFISMASHELKTPITSLQIFVQLLERELVSDEKASAAVRKVKGQTERLKEIINDLLDVSRIETGKMKLSKEEFFLDELIDDTLSGLRDTIVQHVLVSEDRAHVAVYADRFRIYQVLVNLITNAVKYSPGADKVIIQMKTEGSSVVVSVRDFGIGIPKSHQKQIFEKLYQITGKGQRSQSGLGMGLYISKEIINAHDGKIWVVSKKGKGSTFYFSLPVIKS